MEREAQLLEWRLTLTEERNSVMVPSAGSGIPGAPAEWYNDKKKHFFECHIKIKERLKRNGVSIYRIPLPGMENHTPVLFLDLKRKQLVFRRGETHPGVLFYS